MAEREDSPFNSWVLTDEEQAIGSYLTAVQRMVIQNELAASATELLLLKPDSVDKDAFMLKRSYLQGKCETLQLLLTNGEEAEAKLQEITEARRQSQSQE